MPYVKWIGRVLPPAVPKSRRWPGSKASRQSSPWAFLRAILGEARLQNPSFKGSEQSDFRGDNPRPPGGFANGVRPPRNPGRLSSSLLEAKPPPVRPLPALALKFQHMEALTPPAIGASPSETFIPFAPRPRGSGRRGGRRWRPPSPPRSRPACPGAGRTSPR